ncbi:tyrosine-type recombinase/integrase [Yoonia sp.]|uniref:tyrosine-type recombinase/integrase n=1 Tax=Yoonia sp. TaxID=2212373 RepID=UPI0035C85F6D
MRSFSKLFGQSQAPAAAATNQPAKLTLEAFFDLKYYAFIQATKRRSKHDFYLFNKHIRPVLGAKLLNDISSEDIDHWMLHQMEVGYKSGTVNKHASMLNRTLNIAVHWGYLEKNAFKGAAIRKLPVGDYVQRFLTRNEISQLLSACKQSTHPYLYLFVKLLLLTGARKSELRLAKWKDIDDDKMQLFVAISKSGRSRKIMLSNQAVKVLDKVRLRTDALGLPTTRDDWLFPNPRTRKPYTSFHLAFFAARKHAGLNTVRVHDLRHTYASLLINNGASIYEVQQLLGHYHISMTERYAQLFPNTLKDRVNIIASTIDMDVI